MHVLEALDYDAPYPGGIVDLLLCLAREFRGRGDRLTLAFPRVRPWFEPLAECARVIALPSIRRPVRSGFRRNLGRICAEDGVDLIHTHFSFAMPFALALAGSWPVPVVHHWCNPPRALQTGRAAGPAPLRSRIGRA